MDLYDDHAIVGMTVQILLDNLRIPTNIRIFLRFLKIINFLGFVQFYLIDLIGCCFFHFQSNDKGIR